MPLSLLVVVALVLATLAIVSLARHRRTGLHIRAQGISGPIDVYDAEWEDGRPVRVLATGTSLQSAVYLDSRPYDPVFEYYVLFDLMFEGTRPVDRALLMGGGGYAYPRYVLHTHPDLRLDVIELDPAVTRLAMRYMGLRQLVREVGRAPHGRLGLHTGDARTFLEESTHTYDAILNDCFSGDVPAPALATVEAAQLVQSHLAPGGLFLSNVISALDGPRGALLRALTRTYGQVFRHVYVVPCGRNATDENDNNLLVASDEPFPFPAARKVAFSSVDPILTDADNRAESLVARR